MSVIQTVYGRIPPEALGFCHSHEHILVAKGKPFEVDQSICMDNYGKSLEELLLFKSAGGSAIIDAQPVGAGRMSRELARLSAESGVHIVASTGFHKMCFYEDGHWIFSWDEKQLEELFLHELNTGMFVNTDSAPPKDFHDSKAGVIKVAFDTPGLDGHYTKLFTAAAMAGVKTGTSILIHIEKGTNPIDLDDFLDTFDLASHKRIYCHLDRAVEDINIHIELCKRGCYVEYDTIHRLKYHDDAFEVAIIRQILDAGYGDRILLGLDATSKRLKSYGGDIGLDYIKNEFIPLMEAAGIERNLVYSFMLENTAQAFRKPK